MDRLSESAYELVGSLSHWNSKAGDKICEIENDLRMMKRDALNEGYTELEAEDKALEFIGDYKLARQKIRHSLLFQWKPAGRYFMLCVFGALLAVISDFGITLSYFADNNNIVDTIIYRPAVPNFFVALLFSVGLIKLMFPEKAQRVMFAILLPLNFILTLIRIHNGSLIISILFILVCVSALIIVAKASGSAGIAAGFVTYVFLVAEICNGTFIRDTPHILGADNLTGFNMFKYSFLLLVAIAFILLCANIFSLTKRQVRKI